MSEPGITHSDPGTADITGAATGGSGGAHTAPASELAAPGPSLRNEGVLNPGSGHINMSGCVTGPGASRYIPQALWAERGVIVVASAAQPEPEGEPEAGS